MLYKKRLTLNIKTQVESKWMEKIEPAISKPKKIKWLAV